MAISKTGLFLIGVYTLLASIAIVPSQADIDFNPTGSPVGGGAGYQNMVSANQADYTVASESELLNALASAISGQVIYVDDAAQVDMSGESSLIIPAGVTLAGGRGQNIGGAISQGGLIYTSQYNTYPLFLAGGTGVRVTGLRLRGPYSERGTVEISRAIDTSYNGLEVDNCELWAWSHVAIYLIHGTDAADKPYIHHNYIHHCQRDGYGYGVVVSHAYATIEANLFDWCRHAIAGSGYADSGYEARYNLVLENANSHSFDMHGRYEVGEPDDVAGDWIWIHHNIFRATHQRAIAIRGVPASWAKIEHNRLLHTDPNFAIAEWVTNVRKDGYTDNFDVWNNQFGVEEHIRGLWHFDEGADTMAKDLSGNDNHGSLVNMDTGTCWVDGKIGKALAFDGINDYVDCGKDTSLDIEDEDNAVTDTVTVSAWVKFDSLTNGAAPLDNNLYRLYYSGGKIYFLYRIAENTYAGDSTWNNWAGIASMTTVQQNKWYYVTGVKSGNTMSLYINGAKERELSCLTGYTADNSQLDNLLMGSGGFNGKLDEVRIYSTALSADSIHQHWLEGQTRGQWLLDEGQGTTAGDSSDNNNNGTLVNMDTNTCWVNGRLGKALAFDGVNDYVNCGSNSSLNITDAITIETWIKFDSFADWVRPLNNNLYQIFHRGGSDHRIFFLYHIVENTRSGDSSWNNWSGVASTTSLQAGQWYHVACVKSGNTMSIYINGVKERELDCLAGYTIDNTQMTNLNLGAGYNYFNGQLDEVRIYSTALSADSIYQHYFEGQTRGQWLLDEGQGTTAGDSSGNNNNGTLVNMDTNTCWVNGRLGKALAFDGVNDYVNCGSNSSLNITDA
ncbi:MAG: LamG domain-containing protein, partial [bacterium]|nr:LamG domain-containing protein [bacterium]